MDTSSNKLKKLLTRYPRHCLWRGNLERETESLLIAGPNNAIKTNHVKAKIDYM